MVSVQGSHMLLAVLPMLMHGLQPAVGLGASKPSDEERIKLGREKYEAMRRDSAIPRYGPCWLAAIGELEIGCKHLSEDVQHRLAHHFTHCFLSKTGRETKPCSAKDDLESCIGAMKPEAFNVYTEFFTHTQNICFFLESQAWQERSELTIDRLADNSELVARQIEDSSRLQSEIMKQQNDTIKNQEVLLERGIDLRSTLEQSKTDVRLMLQELKMSTSEQRSLIFEVFDRVNSLQSLVMGEFTGFYSLIFYAISILVVYLLTSTPRTSGARFWLFLIMTFNMVAERSLTMWGIGDETDVITGHPVDENTMVFGRLRWCRRVFTSFAVVVWGWVAYRYQDLNKINNQLLVDIKRQNSELKCLLEGTKHGNMSHKDFNDDVDSGHTAAIDVVNVMSDSLDISSCSTGYESYPTDSSDSTDNTYVQQDDSNESESESEDGFASGRSTPCSLLDEMRDLRESTPFREFAALIRPERESSPFGKRSTTPQPETPTKTYTSSRQARTPVPVAVCPYNLRNRRPGMSSNPLVYTESPNTFGRHVKKLAMLAIKNRSRAIEQLSAQPAADVPLFSSDED